MAPQTRSQTKHIKLNNNDVPTPINTFNWSWIWTLVWTWICYIVIVVSIVVTLAIFLGLIVRLAADCDPITDYTNWRKIIKCH